jgi:hypothetical protein
VEPQSSRPFKAISAKSQKNSILTILISKPVRNPA